MVAVAKQVNVATHLEVKGSEVKVQSVSCYAEVQAEISAQVQSLVDQRLHEADRKIRDLATSIEQLVSG